ncbi:hypothetical protein [Rossellomorea sp. BNER]|uniref:hypothetical protein n=1 Tax=Rossellomorea sp. BNER TaxID=2962031 RepID=UPI003AF228F4|nr:hypothetical protein [Rossellomorea sp. BNER]
MDTGYLLSLIITPVLITIILSILIPMEKKYIVRKEKCKIDYEKSKIIFRWNRFDYVSIAVAIYATLNTLTLFFLIADGEDFTNSFVQFTSNQAQAWTFVGFLYFIIRISQILKGIKELKMHE